MGFLRVRSIAIASVVMLVAVAISGYLEHRLLERSGLAGPAFLLDHPGGGDAERWGYVIFPAREAHRLVVQAPPDMKVSVELDGQRVIEDGAIRREARVVRGRGLHQVTMTYAGPWSRRAPKLLWTTGEGTPTDIPSLLLVADAVSTAEVGRRIAIARSAPYAPFACSLLLLAILALGGAGMLRRLFGSGTGPWWVWIVPVAIFTAGIGWGLPDAVGWAPDELNPAAVRDAMAVRFSGGWATLYPPLHYVMFALVDAPFHVFLALGLGDFTDLRFYNLMFLAGRGLSVLMALGIVATTFGLGRELAGARAGLLAALTLTVALPLAYYAKFANLDVPYVFWLTLSMLFFLRAIRDGRPRDFYLFAGTGVVAICTKDQAYGFYVLPALYMILGRFGRQRVARRGVPPVRTLAGMIAITIAGVTILQNVVFNPAGFLEHLRILVGPGSESFRMFSPGPLGQVRLLVSSIRQMGDAMSWPLFAVGLCAVVNALRTRSAAILWLLLPAISYYLTVIAVVGYHYDRFFLGIIVPVAIASGWWLDRWLGAEGRFRRWRAIGIAAAFVYALARVVALDVTMIRDSRYFVENWIVARAAPHERVVASGLESYLPRRSKVFYERMPQDVAELEAVRPDYVIVNPGFSSRRSPGSHRHEMYEALRSGTAGYDLVLRHRTRLAWSPLNLEKRFTEPDHDQFSNLTKINPLIEVYRRRAMTTPATSPSHLPSSPSPTSR